MNKLFLFTFLFVAHRFCAVSQSALQFSYFGTQHTHENTNTIFRAKFTNGTLAMDTGYALFFLNTPAYSNYQYFGNYYVLASFNRNPEDSDVARLNSLGIQLLHYVPQQTYIIAMPANVTLADVNLQVNTSDFWFKAIDSLPLALRVDSSVVNYLNNVTINSLPVLVGISLFDNVNNIQKINDLNFTGASLVAMNDSIYTLFAMMTPASITTVSNMPWVQYMNVYQPPSFQTQIPDTSLNEEIQPSLVDYYHNNTLLTGNYTTVNTYETEQPYLFHHIDNDDNILNWNSNPAATVQGFQVPVCGIVGGRGVSNPKYRGLAPNASIYAFDEQQLPWYSIAPPTNTDFDAFLTAASDIHVIADVLVANTNSNWCGSGAKYNIISEIADYLLLKAPHVVCVNSIGSSCSTIGYGSVVNENAASKNTLSVGSYDYTKNSLVPNCPWGPVYDGRMKPDLLAKTGVMAPAVDLNDLTVKNLLDNFSIPACPTSVTAGASALLHEAIISKLKKGKGMTIKAAFLNSAQDIENPGPDYKTGFGLLDVYSAVNCIDNSIIASVNQGDISVYTFDISKSTQSCKVFLYWNDEQNLPGTATSLMNDLDLWVEDPNGKVTKPLVLNPNSPSALALKGADHLNNCEQVVLDTIPLGTYKIYVKGTITKGEILYAVNVDFREKCLQIVSPQKNEKVGCNTSVQKPFRISWVNNSTSLDPDTYRIKVSLTFFYSSFKYESYCNQGRYRNNTWMPIIDGLPINSTSFDFYFDKYTNNQHTCNLFYDKYFKVKVEIYNIHSKVTYCSDESDYFSLINAPANIYKSTYQCVQTINWDADNKADGFYVYRADTNTPNNWVKVGRTRANHWSTVNEPPGEYYYAITSFIHEDLFDFLESDRSKNIRVNVYNGTLNSPYFINIQNPFIVNCEAFEGKTYDFYLTSTNLPAQWMSKTNWQWEQSPDNGQSWGPISGANSTNYSLFVQPYYAGWKFRLSAYSNNFCLGVHSNEITIILPLNPYFSQEIVEIIGTDFSKENTNEFGYIQFNPVTKQNLVILPEAFTYQWQVAFLSGFTAPPNGFIYQGLGFKNWMDIDTGTVLTILNNTTTDEIVNFSTNGNDTILAGHFQCSISGYRTNTLQWKFLTGTAFEMYSRKYPHLFRLRVIYGCDTAYSINIDPDPLITGPGSTYSKPTTVNKKNSNHSNMVKNDAEVNSPDIVYPNPALHGHFYISLPKNQFSYDLYNCNGQLLLSGDANGLADLHLSQFAAGIYFVSIRTQGQIITRKIQIIE